MEEWKDVVGYEGYYKVSNIGRIKSVDRKVAHSRTGLDYIRKGTVLSLKGNNNGYKVVTLNKKGSRKSMYVHRIVAEAFIKNPENKITVNHKNGDKSDNKVINLEWCTYKENNEHAVKENLYVKQAFKGGENHTQSKLTKKDVLQIRKMHKNNSKVDRKKLAKKYGVKYSTISQVILRINWAHV